MRTILSFLIYFVAAIASAQDSTWQGLDGSWSDEQFWTNGIPSGEMNAFVFDGAGRITQDVADLRISSFMLDAQSAELILDQSLTVEDTFDFRAGTISGFADLNLSHTSTANLGAGANFAGEGDNGGGTMRIQGTANIEQTFTADGFIELSGDNASITGRDLNLNNSFLWNGGLMAGDGTTRIEQGALIQDGTLNRTVESTAGIIMAQNGLHGEENAVWNNVGENAIFKISGDQGLSGEGRLNNLSGAFFKKSGGTGTSVIDWDIRHEGNMILVESGEMSLRGNNFLNSQLMVLEGATLDLKGTTEFGEDVTHADVGTLKFSGGTAKFDHEYQGNLDAIVTGETVLSGSGDIHFNRSLDWRSGGIIGSGTLNLHADTSIAIATAGRHINNFGSVQFENSLLSSVNGSFTNHDQATLNFNGFNNAVLGNGQFVNEDGAVIQSNTGNNWFEWQVENNGTISIENGSQISFHYQTLCMGVNPYIILETFDV
ncbi:MAG: hypothetical protein AAGA30_07070, partial [Planctomycetota bacterium]